MSELEILYIVLLLIAGIILFHSLINSKNQEYENNDDEPPYIPG